MYLEKLTPPEMVRVRVNNWGGVKVIVVEVRAKYGGGVK